MANIFISYRRDDTQMAAGRVYDRLVAQYSQDNVFKDVDNIPYGKDFRQVLSDWVEKTDVMLVLIGKQWLNLKDDNGNRRLDNVDDLVRFEISLGIQLDHVTVIPVIIGDASPPSPEELPTALQKFAYLNAVFVRNDPDFHRDMNRLIDSLDSYLHGEVESKEIKGASLAEKHPTSRRQGINIQMIVTLIGVLAIMITVFGFFQFYIPYQDNQNATRTAIAEVAIETDTPTTLSEEEIRATAAAGAFATLTANVPIDTPTITQMPSNTPIAQSNVQQTVQAEIFTTATSTQLTAEAVANQTQRAEQTQVFVAGLTATQSFDLSQTPPAEDTPQSPTATPIPNMPEPEQMASEGVTSNAEWENLVGESGYVREFDGVEMVLVPSGCFVMGNDSEAYFWNGLPYVQNVSNGGEQCFDEPFWIDKTEVTQVDFDRLGGANNATCFDGENRPVECITWFEARNFCATRSGRLPTEAEWEYVARGPDALYFPWGNSWDTNNAIWNRTRSSSQGTADVGSLIIGASWVGALDMIGNVSEWTQSIYEAYPYVASDGREVEAGSNSNVLYSLRGGSWLSSDYGFLRSASRDGIDRNVRYDSVGFRCVLSYE